MPSAKKDPADVGLCRVIGVLAYAKTKAGEVRMLTRGDVLEPDVYDADSISHLQSIGFVSKPE